MTSVRSANIIKIQPEGKEENEDLIVIEEPLEIRLGYGLEHERKQFTLTITMRTPGNDEELSLGFLFAEGIINQVGDVLSAKYCDDLGQNEVRENVIRVELAPQVSFNPANFNRNFYTNSSCGVCGKASIESVQVSCEPLPITPFSINKKLIFSLPEKLQEAQQVFKYTGGLHASGLFDGNGHLLEHREDVGRHNALDKLLGKLLLTNMERAKSSILLLSGRISFELIQKAIRAQIPVVAAVGAPSSLAVELAESFGITLIGFLKDDRFNVYTAKERFVQE